MEAFLIGLSVVFNIIFITYLCFQIIARKSFSRNKIFENAVKYHLSKIKEQLNVTKQLPCVYNIGENKNVSAQLIHNIRCKLIEKGFIIEEYSQYDCSWLRII